MVAHRRLVGSVAGGLLLLCALYCFLVPRQYEARARVALRAASAGALNLDGSGGEKSGSFASGQVQLETLANVLRSDQLAWEVIHAKKLYALPAFAGSFAAKYPGYRPETPDAAAETYLKERFAARLRVVTVPRTLVAEIRFRSRDPELSSEVVNGLIGAYEEQDAAQRQRTLRGATAWLQEQLAGLKLQGDRDDRRLAEFLTKNRILVSPETLDNGKPGGAEHVPAVAEIDELGHELATAEEERLLREAQYRAAREGDPETVLGMSARAGSDAGDLSASLRGLHARHEELEQELAQLTIERGPNFPRVVEVRRDLADIDRQLEGQRGRLREHFRSAWQTAEDHVRLVRGALEQSTAEGLKINRDLAAYEVMRREDDSIHDLYLRMQDKVAEAGMAAGAQSSDLSIVDPARPPSKPVVPDPPLDFAITGFGAIWLAIGAALLAESLQPSARRVGTNLVAIVLIGGAALLRGQAPTPSTSGLPTGVARIPQSTERRDTPNAQEAPAVWAGPAAASAGMPPLTRIAPLAALIGPGDLLDISEFHTPEFHSAVRVSPGGTVKLPLVDEVRVEGMDELGAAKAIADSLLAGGMLNHPQVFVLVTACAGQDVSVLGEVTRPGVYPYGVHHRMLDLISAASGVTAFAGATVNVFHRSDPAVPHGYVLDPGGIDSTSDHNPELAPGDVVQVRRAGLVYVVGDVIRPGGFVMDPAQAMTVLKALSLAWGPSQNAALTKAILIREQEDGRAVTSLNLKRMLRGKDPDLVVGEHDILFVPNSTAKDLFNRTVESAIQSAAGVSIYAGMVYSQRF